MERSSWICSLTPPEYICLHRCLFLKVRKRGPRQTERKRAENDKEMVINNSVSEQGDTRETMSDPNPMDVYTYTQTIPIHLPFYLALLLLKWGWGIMSCLHSIIYNIYCCLDWHHLQGFNNVMAKIFSYQENISHTVYLLLDPLDTRSVWSSLCKCM